MSNLSFKEVNELLPDKGVELKEEDLSELEKEILAYQSPPGAPENLNPHDFGSYAEMVSCKFLLKIGWRILHKNWRTAFGEVDIIARDSHGHLVFIEVKGRKDTRLSSPEEFVDKRKQEQYIKLASYYLARSDNPQEELRFDVIGLSIHDAEHLNLRYVLNAFEADGY